MNDASPKEVGLCDASSVLEGAPQRHECRGTSVIVLRAEGALFRPDTGECIAGPCRGQALAAAPFAVRDGRVVLEAG